jgi:hypothetical protein
MENVLLVPGGELIIKKINEPPAKAFADLKQTRRRFIVITKEMESKSTYLGDAVYICSDEIGRIWLFTHDGITATNAICLEPQVLKALLRVVGDVS